MENNIEIVIKSDGKKVLMQCHGKDTSKEKAMDAMQKAYLAYVVSLLRKGLTEKEKTACADVFGKMMKEELLDMMEGRSGKVHTTEVRGKNAAFMAELMKRQGEVQDL